MKRLVKTLIGANGRFYVVRNWSRMLLAQYVPKIEIYEESEPIQIMGTNGMIKKRRASLVLCGEAELTREVNMEFFRMVTGFDLSADFQRTDGVFETLFFDALIQEEIDLDGDWTFWMRDDPDVLKRLLTRF